MTYQEARAQMIGKLNAEIERDCTGFRIFKIEESKDGIRIGVGYLRDNTGVDSLLRALENIGLKVTEVPNFVPCDVFPADVATVNAEVIL